MNSVPLICIDPGHGGRDPGRAGRLALEKDLNLKLSLLVRDSLAPDFETIMTRSSDVYVSLLERCRIANHAAADLFISLHHNGFHLPSASGFEVLHWHTSLYGRRLAELILERFEPVSNKFGIRSRGVKPRKNLTVLRRTMMPAVIVECGFLSNPEEELVITNKDYQAALAGIIKTALIDYFGQSDNPSSGA